MLDRSDFRTFQANSKDFIAVLLPVRPKGSSLDAGTEVALAGSMIKVPDGPPTVVASIRIYDGKGNFTQRDYRCDSVPAEFAPKSATAAVISTKSFQNSLRRDLANPSPRKPVPTSGRSPQSGKTECSVCWPARIKGAPGGAPFASRGRPIRFRGWRSAPSFTARVEDKNLASVVSPLNPGEGAISKFAINPMH